MGGSRGFLCSINSCSGAAVASVTLTMANEPRGYLLCDAHRAELHADAPLVPWVKVVEESDLPSIPLQRGASEMRPAESSTR